MKRPTSARNKGTVVSGSRPPLIHYGSVRDALSAAALGLVFTLGTGFSVDAREILKGEGGSLPSPSGSSGSAGTSTTTVSRGSSSARKNLARTAQTLQAIKAMQSAAQAAALGGANNLGADPNHPGHRLPNVANGLASGGLVPDTGLAKPGTANPTTTWQGASTPTQNTANGKTIVTITQTSQQAQLNWQSFNIGKNTTLRFDQSAGGSNQSQWIAFNTIRDPSGVPSQILGSIQATGQVYLINRNGIIFGGSSQINLHSLVASSLPINTNLVERGLLNNLDLQFLFSSLEIPVLANGGTLDAFTPPAAPNTPGGKDGDIVVQNGATLSSPTTADHVGGRIALIGSNVTNAGSISTPDGQTILAAGQQVGLFAHPSSDPGLRGLDVALGEGGGTATNAEGGIIDAPRANITLAGKTVNQLGGITSTTSVSLNGSISLLANYDSVRSVVLGKVRIDPTATGAVTLGKGSVSEILPEVTSDDKVVGAQLALPSKVLVQGETIHLDAGATLFAPSASVTLSAGSWLPLNGGGYQYVSSSGQIYLDQGAVIDVSGSQDVGASVDDNIIAVQLLGSELADSPLQRLGSLRGQTIYVDIRQTGSFNGTSWIGTPLADASGYANLIKHSVAQLTTGGGSVTLSAGGSVVMERDSQINVSGGWTDYAGGDVQTSRVISDDRVFDISQATPDRVYDGIYDGTTTSTHSKWGVTETFGSPLLNGAHYEAGYVEGAKGGSVSITAPAMALDGSLLGNTVSGPRQRSSAPTASGLTLKFQGQNPALTNDPAYSPTPPAILFQSGATQAAADPFSVSASGDPLPLRVDRQAKVVFSPDLLAGCGFGSLQIANGDGSITVPSNVSLTAQPGGSITLAAANLDVEGRVTAPGGSLSFTVYDYSPYSFATLASVSGAQTPPPDSTRGHFTLGAGASLNTAGLIVDDRSTSPGANTLPLVTDGGSISITSYSASLAKGSTLIASGGVAAGSTGKLTYGNGGSISIKVGQDTNIASLIGGQLVLGASLEAYGGGRGGALTIQAPLVRIGSAGIAPGQASANGGTLLVSPEFFSEGGFSSFTLRGLGTVDHSAPGLLVASDTIIAPTVESLVAVPDSAGGTGLVLTPTLSPEGVRSPVSLTLSAPGVRDQFSGNVLVRGDLVLGLGSVIQTDPKGSVSLDGNTVAILGSVVAPGGAIKVTGGKDSTALFGDLTEALATVDLGAKSVLSTAGATLLTPNPLGYRTGEVLSGGNITVSGNIVAEAGAKLDVSGASGTLDLAPAYSGDFSSGAVVSTTPVATRVESNAGTITLTGMQELFSDATLIGAAGGSTAMGGSLVVSSGRFVSPESGITTTVLDPTLVVTQSGSLIPKPFYGAGETAIGHAVLDKDGNVAAGLGHFVADSFSSGGFDALSLQGTVLFSGPVTLTAGRSLTIASSGIIRGDSAIKLNAPYVALGIAFQAPVPAGTETSPFTVGNDPLPVFPTYGTGNLTVTAGLIDIGTLSLQSIGKASFIADNGDIRGDGMLDVAGDIFLRAGQIYPTTAVSFTIAASDYQAGGTTRSGSVTFAASGIRPLPLSAGGQLNVYGSKIIQGGTLRAPIGTINLGWNGTGTPPKDLLTGQAFAETGQLTLSKGSVTSVSAIDPITGEAQVIPYGTNSNGTAWIAPDGTDITVSGVPEKAVNLSAVAIADQSGAVIDIRGGGDLYAYRWVPGSGGSKDVLASSASFAVVPRYHADYAPSAPGYTNSSLSVGDRVYLNGSAGLPAGFYTLLPARYALLPGAFLVTPQSGVPTATVSRPDGTSLVSGYRFNGLDSARTGQPLTASFEVASSAVVRARSQYDDFSANTFLPQAAASHNAAAPRLPVDSGQLVLAATRSMILQGSVSSQAPKGGLGGMVDIGSPSDIYIEASDKSGPVGSLTLDAATLSSFGADSLLIGGFRQTGSTGTVVTVTSNNVTVDNAGSPLSGPDVILVSNQNLTLAAGADIEQVGQLSTTAGTLLFGDANVAGSGNGTLVRVTSDPAAQVVRSGVDASAGPVLTIGAGARISGKGLILDSTRATSLNPTASLSGNTVSLNSGQITFQLTNPGSLQSTTGLVLSGRALQSLQSAAANLSLLSYSSIDIDGTGQVGGVDAAGKFLAESLALHAAEIRGFNNGGGTVTFAAKTITLDNSASGTAPGPLGSPSGTLVFNAGTIKLGANTLIIDNYANLALNASGGILAQGSGSIVSQGSVTITTPVITGEKAASHTISAGGALTVKAPAGSAHTTVTGGLGASLTLQGASVTDSSQILLPSGALTLHATGGDVTLGTGARLDVAGTAQRFLDLIKYTSGGQISLISDAGNVNAQQGSTLTVAAQPDAGNAGTLAISAVNGHFTLAGTVLGKDGSGGLAGTFALDVGSIPGGSLDALNGALNTGNFTESRDIRVRDGDVRIDGPATAHTFNLSADQGSITVGGTVDASGAEGGTIGLEAGGSVTLLAGARLSVAGRDFSHAGKGGAVSLETRGNNGGVIDIQTGSTIDLSVASNTSASADAGHFTGTLHLRAPQTGDNTDLQVDPIHGTILNASSIVIEGYQVYTPVGGSIDSVEAAILKNGETFAGAAGTTTDGYTAMVSRLLGSNNPLAASVSIQPGAEIVNSSAGSNPLTIQLTAANSYVTLAAGAPVSLPTGTPGADRINSTVAGTITLADGSKIPLPANTPTVIDAGSSITLSSYGTLTLSSGATPLPIVLPAAGNFVTGGATSIAANGTRNTVQLNAVNSKLTLAAGTSVAFPNGTPGNDTIKSTSAGVITLFDGSTRTLTANTSTTLPAGSSVKVNSNGTLSFAAGTTGGAIPVTLPATGTFTTTGVVNVSTATGDLTLGTSTSTALSDWDLSTYRFGPNSAPGVLTLRAAGNLVFFNALSDGFTSSAYTAGLLAQNPLLPANAQSWSYRLVSGADLSAADFRIVQPLTSLQANTGSLQLGKDAGVGIASPSGINALTSSVVTNRFQVIRTGSGDIDIRSGRDVQLLNQFATIYTAGTQVADPTLNGTFDVPRLNANGGQSVLGAIQQTVGYPAQYSLGGGDVRIVAQQDIVHLTQNSARSLIADSERELPINWLYRRGFVDPLTGEFGVAKYGDVASTSWWVDFSNFFEGVGALGGGNVTLISGHDVSNVDAVAPTNARMPKGKPDASKLVELGGGDVTVRADHDLDGGVYYVERGKGLLSAGNSIHTNSTRSPSLTTIKVPADVSPAETWLPTTLFLGKGSFEISSVGDLLLGPVANPFLLPQGYNNTFWYKTYFSTYDASSSVSACSLTGDVTLRESATLPSGGSGSATPLLQAWFQKQLLLTSNPASASYYQPWIRLDEASVAPFSVVSALMPGTLRATAFSGDLNLVGNLTLSPSPSGTIDLIAAGSINGLQINGSANLNEVETNIWGSATINLSDADPAALPGIATPHAYQTLSGTVVGQARQTPADLLSLIDKLFAESGSTQGEQGVLQTKQALHDAGVLHADDPDPIHLYAQSGDLSGFTLFAGKAAKVVAGRDITDIALYIQNTDASDSSLVVAGRDLVAYDPNSVLRVAAQALGNATNFGSSGLAGDIQISGPGSLEVLAGRNLDLGVGPNNSDGTALGITSIGNARNPYLPFGGADIIAGAGIGAASGLDGSRLDFAHFIAEFLNPANAGTQSSRYLPALGTLLDLTDATEAGVWANFRQISAERRDALALEVVYLVLRDAGRDHGAPSSPNFGTYKAGLAAIADLFPGDQWQGDISLTSREIKTAAGGSISLLAPGGEVSVGLDIGGNQPLDQGILTEAGGDISIFTHGSVVVGTSRIFTLRGGNEIIWSTTGDIAAGASSKTVQSAPPTRVLIDPQSGDVKTDLAGLATGGGIGVLETVVGVPPGNVDLIAPAGIIDAGDAGIRVSGVINVSAVQIVNASNIQAPSGNVAPAVSAPPSVGNLGSASSNNTAAANSAATSQSAAQRRNEVAQQDIPSIVTVEVLGYGGDDGSENPDQVDKPQPAERPPVDGGEDEDRRKKKKQA